MIGHGSVSGATRGNWSEAWEGFDKRQKAKARKPANEDGGDGDDMFAKAGVAAE